MKSSASCADGKCSGCRVPIEGRQYLICAKCKHLYDIDCANITDKRFQSMDRERRAEWICPECINKVPKQDNRNTPVRSAAPSPPPCVKDTSVAQKSINKTLSIPMESQNVTLRTKKSPLPCDSKIKPGTSASSDNTNDLIVAVQHEINKSLKSTIEACVTRLLNDFSNDFFLKFETLTSSIVVLTSRMDSFESRVSSLEACVENTNSDSRAAEEVMRLKTELNDRDQELLLSDLEITGVPETESENTVHLVTLIARKLGVNLDERDIANTFRMGARPKVNRNAASPRVSPKNQAGSGDGVAVSPGQHDTGLGVVAHRPLVVRLVRRVQRDQLLRAARVRRTINTEGLGLGNSCPLYVNERLTRLNRYLFYKCRLESRRLGWDRVWTWQGGIYARRASGEKTWRIRSEADINEAFGG